ncbi:MAG: glycine cleavage system aminomethyltransferase GcvT [Sporichthyaceae bacterium]
MSTALRQSPLHERHVESGAKLADFGGWEMPIDYGATTYRGTKLGVVAEHTAVRTGVGIFDVSHLGKITVTGPGAAAFVDSCLTNALERITAGQAQYSLCCDEATGGVVDDLIVYLRSDRDVLLVPNAANCAEVAARLTAAAPSGVAVRDRHCDLAVIAVQGPVSAKVLGKAGLAVRGLDYMSFLDTTWRGAPLVICRSGYTGEHGFELLPGVATAADLWEELLTAGQEWGAVPCGLGARDTLRTEMGYPLHGQDISVAITPVQAGLGWAIGWGKAAFWGREVLAAERAAGRSRRLVGLEALGPQIPRAHMSVRSDAGDQLGEITSGTFSPTRKLGIALALVVASVADGDEVVVDVRGRPGRFRVVRPPFVPSRVRS